MLSFRHLLEQHVLTVVLFEAINAHLKAQGLLVSKGTMVDATLIHAPSSTKNREQARGPEMRQTKKGSHGTWHEGADVDLEAVHTVEVTLPMKRASTSCPSCYGWKTMLFSAMQAAPVMNTNADRGNWEYAGACKTNSSQDRVSGEVRRSVTGSTSRSGHGWNMYSGRSSGSLDSPRPLPLTDEECCLDGR